jgi:hypothetical protein
MEIPMSKRPTNRATKAVALASQPIQPSHAPTKTTKETTARVTKQARVLAMLRSATGATIPTIMKATDWQQHSVRGFLAGVVKKKLKLKIKSEKIGDRRVYRIVEPAGTRSKPARSRPRAA